MFETRAPAAKFAAIGDQVKGEIVDVRRTQQTEYKTNIPYYWENKQRVTRPYDAAGQPNDPMLQTEITLDTGVPDENGLTERRIFIRGKRMNEAFKQAIAAGGGGRDGLLIGGDLATTWSGEEPSQGGGNPAKLYTFQYRAPAAGEGRKPDPTPVLFGGGPPPAPQPSPVPAFNLRPPAQNVPLVAPYATASVAAAAPAAFDDEPPF